MIYKRDHHNCYKHQLTKWFPSKEDLEFSLELFRDDPNPHHCVVKSKKIRGVVHYAVFIKKPKK